MSRNGNLGMWVPYCWFSSWPKIDYLKLYTGIMRYELYTYWKSLWTLRLFFKDTSHTIQSEFNCIKIDNPWFFCQSNHYNTFRLCLYSFIYITVDTRVCTVLHIYQLVSCNVYIRIHRPSQFTCSRRQKPRPLCHPYFRPSHPLSDLHNRRQKLHFLSS